MTLQTIKDQVRHGKVAIENNGSYEELCKIIKAIEPRYGIVLGRSKFYRIISGSSECEDGWYGNDATKDIPTIKVTEVVRLIFDPNLTKKDMEKPDLSVEWIDLFRPFFTKVSNACRRGHNLNGRKMSGQQVDLLIAEIREHLWSSHVEPLHKENENWAANYRNRLLDIQIFQEQIKELEAERDKLKSENERLKEESDYDHKEYLRLKALMQSEIDSLKEQLKAAEDRIPFNNPLKTD